MANPKQYDFSKGESFMEAFTFMNYLKEKQAIVEIKEVSKTRSSLQNRSLHLFFRLCCDALNDAGIEFEYRGLKGMSIDVPWNPELFKEFIWRPIQLHMIGKKSTTQLTTKEIDPILETIIRHFGTMGLEVSFPSQFDVYLKQCQ